MNPAEYAQLRQRLVKHEGLRLKPYTDTANRLTIGVGRNLTDKGISQAEAMELLDNDIAIAASDVQINWPWSAGLEFPRLSVLLEMAFNLGVEHLRTFTKMLDALKRGDYDGAATEMLNSQWAKQVGQRAVTLAQIMRTGVL